MGTLIDRRKHMSAAYRPAGYIQDGLVFWLDGINKGANDGTWVDLVGGKVFSTMLGTPAPMENSFYFDGASALKCLSSISDVETIEFCIKMSSPKFIFANFSNTFLWNIAASGTGFIYKVGGGSGTNGYNGNLDTLRTVSVSFSKAIGDGQALTYTTYSDAILSNDIMAIGGRDWASFLGSTGYIHSIRMYKRSLSNAEMLHNQQIDNERFNLGLII